MNRYEYENTLRDLLGAPWLQVKEMLPEDGLAHRLNKSGEALDVSRSFRELVLTTYPTLTTHEHRQAYLGMLQHLLFTPFLDEQTGQTVFPSSLVARVVPPKTFPRTMAARGTGATSTESRKPSLRSSITDIMVKIAVKSTIITSVPG